MVANFFALIDNDEPATDRGLPPITSSLVGILKDKDIKEDDYKSYLEEKH